MLLLIRSLPLSFALNFVPRIMEMAFQKLFLGENAHRPARLRVLTAPCSYSWLFFSNQLPTSNFIETPELITTISPNQSCDFKLAALVPTKFLGIMNFLTNCEHFTSNYKLTLLVLWHHPQYPDQWLSAEEEPDDKTQS